MVGVAEEWHEMQAWCGGQEMIARLADAGAADIVAACCPAQTYLLCIDVVCSARTLPR